MRLIMELADRGNRFVEQQEPWKLKDDEDQAERLQDICTIALNLFRQIVIYLSPVLPKIAAATGTLLNDPIQSWDQSQSPLTGTDVGKFKHMLKRLEVSQVDKMIEESRDSSGADKPEATTTSADAATRRCV